MEQGDIAQTTSIFNTGIKQIQTIGSIWDRCDYYARKGLLKEWRWSLDRMWVELYVDAKKAGDYKEDISYEKKCEEYDRAIKIAFKNNLKGLSYELLKKKELFLRELLDKSGKGGKYYEAEDDEFDI